MCLLTEGAVPKDPACSHHVQEEEARSMHPPSVECYAFQAFSIASNFDSKLMPKKQNQITMRKFAPSYNPFFRVNQIINLVTAGIARNITRFSYLN